MKKSNGMTYINEETVSYMDRVWGFNCCESVDDTLMFWECGEYKIVALRLVNAGAVEPNCKEAKEMIRVAKSISQEEQDEIITECLKGYTILECSNCNHVHFISEWNNPQDWIKDGCNSCAIKGHVKEVRKRT